MPNYIDALGDAVRGAIRAYHGSPYDFDAFDAAKIGTGEGNQAYGRGLYFAGNQNVARTYRDDLSRRSMKVEGAKTPWTESTMDDMGVRPSARVAIRMAMRDQADPINRLLQAQSGHSPLSKYWNEYQDAIKLLQGATGKLIPNPGKMYEVEIAHPENSLLDYDATLPNQPEHVRSILPSLNLPLADATPPTLKAVYGIEEPTNITGREIQIALNRNEMAHRGAEWAQREAAAAKTFADAGIPGVRYLDQGSRNTGPSGTRNYVMFPGTEDSIRILRKYGIGGAAAGAAMSDEEQY